MKVEKYRLFTTCEKCGHHFLPFGNLILELPHSGRCKCPSCGYVYDDIWLDKESRSELARKRAGLEPKAGSISDSKLLEELMSQRKIINELKEEVDKLKNERSEDKGKIAGVETHIQDLRKDLKGIHKYDPDMTWLHKYLKQGSKTEIDENGDDI